MTQFTYHGPVASVPLRLKDGKTLNVHLAPGQVAELPPDHPYVRRLVARGLLTPVMQQGSTKHDRKKSEEKATPTSLATLTAPTGDKS